MGDGRTFKINFNEKRSNKKESADFFVHSFAALKAGVPGQTKEVIAEQAGYRNHFIYEGELKPLIEKLTTKDPNYDVRGLLELLRFVNAVKVGEAPAFGGRTGEHVTSIDSLERAKEVAIDETSAVKLQAIMAQMVKLRKEADPYMKKGCGLSIALKNPPKKKKSSPEDSTSTAEPKTGGQTGEQTGVK